jgi:hypothetical protein
LDEHKATIANLEKEAASYNNPENFAKFGKLNRLIFKMQQETKKLEAEAQAAA